MSFAVAVAQVIRAHSTGVLELHDTLGVNRAYFVDGAPQGGRLARMRHPLGRLIVDEGLITEAQLNDALASQRASKQLLGQVLIEAGLINESALDALIKKQSQLNLFSLFGAREGRLSFKEGAVHLTNFTPAPLPPAAAVYFGLRRSAGLGAIEGSVTRFLTAGLRVYPSREDVLDDMPPAEAFAIEWLQEPRFAGELARALPLPGHAIAFLLFALDAVGALEHLPPRSVPLATAS